MKKILSTFILSTCLLITAHAQYSNEKMVVGQKAPDLEYAKPDGKMLKLSSITKGHIVLLDFWASWCGPCRRANPNLVAMYGRYKDMKFKGAKKGFTMVSVSLDQKKDAWIQAIAKDSLYWDNHMSDLGGWQSAPAEKYGVQFIPQAFLIGPDGVLIGKYNFAEEAEEELKKRAISDN